MDESRDIKRLRHSSEQCDNHTPNYDNHYDPSSDNYNQGFNIYNHNVENNELQQTLAAHDDPTGGENVVPPENRNSSRSTGRRSNRTTSSSSETTSDSSGFASSSSGSEEGSAGSSSSVGAAHESSGSSSDSSGSSSQSSGTTSSGSGSESGSASSIYSSSSFEDTSTSGSSTSGGSSSVSKESSGYYECTSSGTVDSSTESKYSSTESEYSSTEYKDSSTVSEYSCTESKDSSTISEYSCTGCDPVGMGSEYIGYGCEYECEAVPTHYRSVPFASLGWSISFSGCGFLGIYHLGVVHSLTTHGRKLLLNISRFGGASAGSLVASALATRGFEHDIIEKSAQFCYDLAETARNKPLGVLSPTMSLLNAVRAFLLKILPEDAHLRATNRLYVSVTELLANENHLICEFTSKEHLISCLLASSLIPYLTGKELILIEKKCYVDGGMTDNLPDIPGSRTILVSPFAGRQHICPVDVIGKRRFVHIHGEEFDMSVNNMKRAWHAFFPPSQEDLEKYFERGKRDCIRFLKKENFYENAAWPS